MFGLHGKLRTQQGKRQILIDHLLHAAEILQAHDGCYLYVISEDPTDEEAVLVTEVWRSSEDHQASLTLDAVKNLIALARPILAGAPEGVVMHPIGGKGVPRSGK